MQTVSTEGAAVRTGVMFDCDSWSSCDSEQVRTDTDGLKRGKETCKSYINEQLCLTYRHVSANPSVPDKNLVIK